MLSAAATWQDNIGGLASGVLVIGFISGLIYAFYKLARWIGDITEKLTRNTAATEVVQAAVTPNHGTSMADKVEKLDENMQLLLVQHQVLLDRQEIQGRRLQAVEAKVHDVRTEQSKVADALSLVPPITGEVPIISNRAESGGRVT